MSFSSADVKKAEKRLSKALDPMVDSVLKDRMERTAVDETIIAVLIAVNGDEQDKGKTAEGSGSGGSSDQKGCGERLGTMLFGGRITFI